MSKENYYLFVGPDPKYRNDFHPGGQMTAAIGIKSYFEEKKINLKIINSLQSPFELPSIKDRILKALKRIINLIFHLKRQHLRGVIIFSACGLSFFEKSIMALLCRLFDKQSIICIRSGFFIKQYESKFFYKFFYRILLKLPKLYGVQGTSWVDFLNSAGVQKSKIKVIRNWVLSYESTNNFKVIKRNQVNFLFVGWLTIQKGILDLIEAYSSSKILLESKLYIAGSGDLKTHLESLKKKNTLNNVELLGWLNKSSIGDLMSKTDVLVFTSYAEGFPNVIAEGLWKSLPIISSNVGGIPDSVIPGYNGFLFEPGDVKTLRVLMEKIITEKDLMKSFSKNSLTVAKKNHSLIKNCDILLKAIS